MTIAPIAAGTVVWLTVRVDEDGVMIVRDEVENLESASIPTVMTAPKLWADRIGAAVLDLLDRAGQDVS